MHKALVKDQRKPFYVKVPASWIPANPLFQFFRISGQNEKVAVNLK